jgi:hypothetical protein
MKTTPADLSQLAERLRAFLAEEGWTQGRQARGMAFYYAPEKLGIHGKFSVALPDVPTSASNGSLLYEVANSLAEIYGFGSVGELLDKAAAVSDEEKSSRIVTRFIDSATQSGAIPLTSLASYIANMAAGLYRSAKFKLGEETKETRLIAQRFAKECLFLQTGQGSFVAKVEIPHSVLKQGDLFGAAPLFSAEVCSSFFSALQFLNEDILGSDDSFDEERKLEDSLALFDVELLESLTKVLVESEINTIEFSLAVGSQIRTSSTGVLSEERKTRLKDFLNFVREQLRGENDLDVSGQIVELRSRDPDGNKNYIRVVSQFHGDKTFISAILTNEQYQLAVDAHRNKRGVRLRGNGTRLKTQIRMTEIRQFTTA